MAQRARTLPQVASVARAIALLEQLRDSEEGLGVNELARRIGVNPSTASRLLATLQSAGLVQRDGQGPFRLGLALVTLADRVLSRLDLQALARPVLVELMERTGETSTLSLPGDREAITVDSAPSRSSVVSMARLGRPSIAHATAVGDRDEVAGERDVDVNAIAAPVLDRASALAAILGIQGPAGRLENPARVLATLRDGVATLTAALGGAYLPAAK
jgi:IclR family acetate operon transcriptional repressor